MDKMKPAELAAKLQREYPNLWNVLIPPARNRSPYKSQMMVSEEQARNLEEIMNKYGIITVSTIRGKKPGQPGYRVYWTLTDYGEEIVKALEKDKRIA
jgi:hypothetical protein